MGKKHKIIKAILKNPELFRLPTGIYIKKIKNKWVVESCKYYGCGCPYKPLIRFYLNKIDVVGNADSGANQSVR